MWETSTILRQHVMAIINRQDILVYLDTSELFELIRHFELPPPGQAHKDALVAFLTETDAVTLGQMLMMLPRKRLKELCRARHLDDSGREKMLIVTRLLGVDPDAPPPPKAVPPIRRRRQKPIEG